MTSRRGRSAMEWVHSAPVTAEGDTLYWSPVFRPMERPARGGTTRQATARRWAVGQGSRGTPDGMGEWDYP
jgi:hypothetical protein